MEFKLSFARAFADAIAGKGLPVRDQKQLFDKLLLLKTLGLANEQNKINADDNTGSGSTEPHSINFEGLEEFTAQNQTAAANALLTLKERAEKEAGLVAGGAVMAIAANGIPLDNGDLDDDGFVTGSGIVGLPALSDVFDPATTTVTPATPATPATPVTGASSVSDPTRLSGSVVSSAARRRGPTVNAHDGLLGDVDTVRILNDLRLERQKEREAEVAANQAARVADQRAESQQRFQEMQGLFLTFATQLREVFQPQAVVAAPPLAAAPAAPVLAPRPVVAAPAVAAAAAPAAPVLAPRPVATVAPPVVASAAVAAARVAAGGRHFCRRPVRRGRDVLSSSSEDAEEAAVGPGWVDDGDDGYGIYGPNDGEDVASRSTPSLTSPSSAGSDVEFVSATDGAGAAGVRAARPPRRPVRPAASGAGAGAAGPRRLVADGAGAARPRLQRLRGAAGG